MGPVIYIMLQAVHPLQAHGDFYYLAFLGVEPELRGNGLGGAMLQRLTARADAEQRWMYLAATSESNRRLYKRHGFQDDEHRRWTADAVPGAAVNLYFMARPPSIADGGR